MFICQCLYVNLRLVNCKNPILNHPIQISFSQTDETLALSLPQFSHVQTEQCVFLCVLCSVTRY